MNSDRASAAHTMNYWLSLGWFVVTTPVMATSVDLSRIKLPQGFQIEVYAEQVPNARSMALGDDGTVYVGSRTEGKVYALPDQNHDYRADRVYTLASGLKMPNGVAFLNGALYIAEVDQISRLNNISSQLAQPPKPERVYDLFPSKAHHGWKYLRAGPDHKLYTAVGAPCNVCLSEEPIFATLVRMAPDGSDFEIMAHGVRNSVGFDWHPQTGELWFHDNGRDHLGDDVPADELNHLTEKGAHFGFPYCHAGEVQDPKWGQSTGKRSCSSYTAPAWKYPAHVAPLGMRFYQGKQFPAAYQGQLLVAQHGSWNRSTPQGYRVALVTFKSGQPVSEQVFAEGWLQKDGEAWGRPVDLLELPDGSVLISDDRKSMIYRVHYASDK